MISPSPSPPIACILGAGDFKSRMTWIARLNAEHLIAAERSDLVLTLTYANAAEGDVRELVRREQQCCAFLSFDVQPTEDRIHLTVTAPEDAREAAEDIFRQFAQHDAAASPRLGASSPSRSGRRLGRSGVALAIGGVAACAACCAPLVLPLLATVGGSAAGGAGLGAALGFSAADIACLAVAALLIGAAVFLVARRRSAARRKATSCGCSPSDVPAARSSP